jgi:sugar phosphate isomerase/epimerase
MTDTRVFISTGGDKGRTATECARDIVSRSRHGVELSGGKSLADPEGAVTALSHERKVLLHNYFPPPSEPFVLNLSDPDHEAAKDSLRLVRRAIAISAKAGASHYAVHAGFLAKPSVAELGERISARAVLDRGHGIELMIARLLELSFDAEAAGVRLLVENHVLSEANLESFGENFLLMVDPEEIQQVLAALEGRVGFLLDVGHLNTSAHTLGLDPREALKFLDPYAEGYHLSSNDGRSDQHSPISTEDWFWEGISRERAFYTVEIHSTSIGEWVESADLVQGWLDQTTNAKATS